MSKVNYLLVEDIIELNRATIEKHGGTFGILDKGLIESAAALPAQSFWGQEIHPTIGEKAGAYLFHVAKAHAFEDGNKRTALDTCALFLEKNGYEFALTNEQSQKLVVDVAEDRISKDKLLGLFNTMIREAEQQVEPAQTKSNTYDYEPER